MVETMKNETTGSFLPLRTGEVTDEVRAKYAKYGYTYLLVFVREFTHGTVLVGTQHSDWLPFCSAEACEEWVRGINKQNARRKCTYRVTTWNVERLGVAS